MKEVCNRCLKYAEKASSSLLNLSILQVRNVGFPSSYPG